MELDDYVEPRIAVAVAATAVVLSPGVRRVLRRGVVYALAGGMMATGALSSFGRGVAEGARSTAESATGGEGTQPAQQPGGAD